ALIPRRPDQRLRLGGARVEPGVLRRADVGDLLARPGDLEDARAGAIDDVGVARIRDHGAPLPGADRAPVHRGDGAVVPAAPGADRARVLLAGVDPVGERAVHRDVVDLLGGLVVPRTPGAAAVQRHDGAL